MPIGASPGGRLSARHLFLTGQPGVGKTTLVRQLAALAPCGGFYTEECRKQGVRVGFDVVTIAGARGPLAREGRGKAMVGKYAVDVASFEHLALPTLDEAIDSTSSSSSLLCCSLDEVGKMELHSHLFLPKVEALLGSGPLVLGTIPMPRYGHKISEVEAIRARPAVAVVKLTKSNRDVAAAACIALVREHAASATRGEAIDVSTLTEFLEEGQAEKLTARETPTLVTPAESAKTQKVIAKVIAKVTPSTHRTASSKPTRVTRIKGAAGASIDPYDSHAYGSHDSHSCDPLIGTDPPPHALLVGETGSPLPERTGFEYSERSMWKVIGTALELGSADFPSVRDALLGAGVGVWDVLADAHQSKVKQATGKATGAARMCSSNGRCERANEIETLLASQPTIRKICFIGAKAKAAFLRHHSHAESGGGSGGSGGSGGRGGYDGVGVEASAGDEASSSVQKRARHGSVARRQTHLALASRDVELVVLPSSSRANTMPLDDKVRAWAQELGI